MTRQDIIDFCLTFPAAYEDYPFDAAADENATAVMRHKGNKKSFALIMQHNGELYLNLKCNPFDGDFLRSAFKSIIPGWHMNKSHWITVVMGGDAPDDLTKTLIGQSYGLVKPKVRFTHTMMKKPVQAILTRIRSDLKAAADPVAAESGKRFFKNGEYFQAYGLKSAEVNRIAKRYTAELVKSSPKEEIFELCDALWQSGYQEEAGVACALSEAVGKTAEPDDFDVFARWAEHYVRNWAMCDTLCNHTIGDLVTKYPELSERLFAWTRSDNRWMKRGAAVTLIVPARRGLFLPLVFRIADALLLDPDDMVQKGYGWMLKAAAAAHEREVFDFVMERRTIMPRTALRYAIEKMPQEKRKLAMGKLCVGNVVCE